LNLDLNFKFELTFSIRILLITIAVSILLIILGAIFSDLGVVGNLIILSTFIVAAPQFIIRYEKFRALKDMESRFPLFLRDIVESLRSGMPLHKSITSSSEVDYGKLSKEVKKMANQISWGMPLDKVIEQFAERVKKSKRLNTALATIRESYVSGGDIISTLESVAETALILEETEKERRSILSQYVVMMYGICFLFIGILVAINRLMVPIFNIGTTSELIGMANPCDGCYGFSCYVCGIFQSVCSVFAIDTTSIGCYYTSLFFFMSVIEAIACGLVAGEISENSVLAGLKHGLVMCAITIGAFNIIIYLGLMGV